MLKVRVLPTLLLQDGLLKKPIRFKNARTVANPLSVARVFEQRHVDELVLLDIGRTVDDDDLDPELVYAIAEELYVPFAYGGGVRTVEEIRDITQAGAEKVVINTAAVEVPGLIEAAAGRFGSQCILVSVDARHNGEFYEVYTRSGQQSTGLEVLEFAKRLEARGAGEILLNSIEHDGVMEGFNLELLKRVTKEVGLPVIAAGGAGELSHFVSAVLEGNASAVTAGSVYLYTKLTPNMVKGALDSAGIPVRMYPDIDYTFHW
jgi:imidazole glycerol-phosphate synthase subunit HisF